MADSQVIKRVFLWVIVAAIFVLTFLVLKPIIIPIVFGLLAAYIFAPVYKRINKALKWPNTSAFIMIIGITAIIAVPVVYLTPSIVTQTFETYTMLQSFDFAEVLSKLSIFEGDAARSFAMNIDNLLGKVFSTFLNQFTDILVNLPDLMLQFAVFLFTFFFAVRDAEELKRYFMSLSPFSESTEKKFMVEFRAITNAIIFGQVLIGIIQGLALGAGLLFLGVSNVLTLTFIACIASIIPIIGAWLVWLPVAIFLLMTGDTFSAVFLILYGSLFVGTIDNLIRPYLLSRQSNLSVAMGVIGTIGGLYFFGIAGLVLGPLVIAYTLIIMEFYRQGRLNELFKKKR